VLDRSASESDLVAVFPAPAASVIASATAGADAAVIGAAALRAMTAYPFTDQSLVDPARRPSQGERLRVSPG
jgi:hypothetical protein